MSDVRPIQRAILAPFDKTGLVEFAAALAERGVELVASGGTAAVLTQGGLPVTAVEQVTGSPEMLGGRVKTLHPKIHGGLLADRRNPEHLEQLGTHDIEPFDLLVGGLYPFRETVASGADPETVVENIDIGGPAMMRAAAKNFESVTVIVDPAEYSVVLTEIEANDGVTRATRYRLAAAAFAHTAAYDAAVAAWFARQDVGHEHALPGFVGLAYEKVADLRYGENPHQRGGLYREASTPGPLGGARVLQGKEMSFNNWLDADAAFDLVASLPRGSAVIVKHNNPCGVASRGSPAASYRAALVCDPVSAFGGIVAFRDEVDDEAVAALADVFTEVVIAPAFTPEAAAALEERPNLRVVRATSPDGHAPRRPAVARRGVGAGPRRADRDTRRLEGRLQPGAHVRGVGRPVVGLDDRVEGEVQHDRPGEGRRHRGCRAPARCPGWIRPGSRFGKRAIVRRGRSWLPTRSSRSPMRSRWQPMRDARP